MFKRTNLLLFSAVFGLLPALACAQENEAGDLEEIIVTAQFRDTELLKTPGSISVIQQATLFDRGAQHLEETLNVLPNVSFTSGASRARFIQVRGVGDLEQFVDPKYFPSVGVTIDDVDMNGLAAAAIMLDIQQIEVLRGPQGTRFGTNALAGMINIRSNEPGDVFNGYAQAGVGNYNSWNVAAAVGGPLSDQFQGRIAVRQNTSDGYINNDYLDRDDTNNLDEFSLRAKLRWLGDDGTHADLTVSYVDIDNGYDAFSLDNDRHTFSDEPGKDQTQSLSVAAKSYWQINPELTLETILSWSDSDTFYSFDEDWSNPDICNGFEFCFPYANTDQQERSRDNISLDSHLLSNEAGHFSWVAGVYTQHRDEDFARQYYGGFVSTYKTKRYAIYGQGQYELSETWRLITGLRFEHFSDDYTDSNGLISETDDQYFTGDITVQHDLGDGSMIYATLSRGVKPGGINTEASSVIGFIQPQFRNFLMGRLQFGSESLLNKEIGIKGRYLDNTLSLRAALFHMDRNNPQLESWVWDDVYFLFIGYLDSVRSGQNYGMELELDYQLSAAVEVFAGIGWLQTNVDEISVVDLGQPGEWTQTTFRDVIDRDQTKAPQWQYNIGTNLRFGDQLSARLEIEGRGDSFYGYYHNQEISGYTLVNASIGYQLGAVTIRAWGRNLADKDYAVHGLYFANDPRKGYVNESYRQFGEPRVFGVDVKYTFY